MHPANHKYLIRLTAGTIFLIIAVLLVILMSIGLGIKKVQKNLVPLPQVTPTISVSISPVVTPVTQVTPIQSVAPDTSCNQGSDCVLDDTNRQSAMQICCNNTCSDYYNSAVIAVNNSWFVGYKGTMCLKRMLCPMFVMMCTAQATQSHTHVTVSCQNHTCTKVIQ